MTRLAPVDPGATQPFAIDNIRAISWILLSVAASSAMTIAVRESSFGMDTRMVVFLRFAAGTVLILAYMLAVRGTVATLRFSRPGLHIWRGMLMAVSTHMGFYAIAKLELVTATVLFFCAPIFATAFAGMIYGEMAGPRRLLAVAAGFAGVLIVLRPGVGVLDPAMLVALGSAILFGLALVLSRPLAQADGTFSTIFSTTLITALVSVPLAIPVWQMPTGLGTTVALLALIVTGFVRMVADLQAYRFGEAASLAPMVYLRLVLIGSAAYFLYGEVPDRPALAGAAVIIGAALYIARREAKLRKRNSTEG